MIMLILQNIARLNALSKDVAFSQRWKIAICLESILNQKKIQCALFSVFLLEMSWKLKQIIIFSGSLLTMSQQSAGSRAKSLWGQWPLWYNHMCKEHRKECYFHETKSIAFAQGWNITICWNRPGCGGGRGGDIINLWGSLWDKMI